MKTLVVQIMYMAVSVLIQIGLLFIYLFTSHCSGIQYSFNAADARGKNSVNQRSNSTTGRVVHLDKGDSISLDFCLRETTKVLVNRVGYSNDGIPDECLVYLDEMLIATFTTRNWTGWGDMWNVFEFTSIRKGLDLPRGWHVIKLELVVGDGVEIDNLEIDFSDTRLTKDMLDCQLLCQVRNPYISPQHNKQPQNGLISQTSYPTKCAEEDNIKIPVILHGIQEYSLRATLPTYRSFENRRDENTTGCAFIPHVYWTFKDIELPSNLQIYESQSAKLTFFSNAARYHLSKTASVTFRLLGQSMGHIDANIGSILKLAIKPVNKIVKVRIVLYGKSPQNVILPSKLFLPGERFKTFDIPDFTWTENSTNSITLTFNCYYTPIIKIEELRLERRFMKPEKTKTIFKNHRIVIDAVYLDFWWRAPEAMTVKITTTGETHENVAYFRVSRPVPWTKDSFAQIFVLYQDGNARLLQLPPSGLDWIPFGSSVIIGATRPQDHRPSAPISEVDIDPLTFQFKVKYMDGGSADFKLLSSIEETEIVVSNLRFALEMSVHPFTTFRSMYVEDGNSDCDSIMIDGKYTYHIMDKWMPKRGKSFMFFRKCESKHLTLSPDILLTIKRTHYGPITSWWAQFLKPEERAQPIYQFRRFL